MIIAGPLIFSTVAFMSFFNDIPNFTKDLTEKIQSSIPKVSLQIASDSNFSNITDQFNSGQTIYVRAEAANSADKKVLNVRDNQYNLITSYTLNQTGSGPYTFTTSFAAPVEAGSYSLEANIEANNSNVTLVRTITVGTSNSSNVKVKVNQSNSSNNSRVLSANTGDAAPSPSFDDSSPIPSPSPHTNKRIGLFEDIWQFLRRVFTGVF